jgi:hypothetical protein
VANCKYLFVGLSILTLPFFSCSSVNGTGSSYAPEVTIVQITGPVKIEQVIENSRALSKRKVELNGAFRGWKGCPASSMITKSDWVLEDETGCIYISGNMPEGVSPTQAEGERFKVYGAVTLDKMGKPAIKALYLAPLPD